MQVPSYPIQKQSGKIDKVKLKNDFMQGKLIEKKVKQLNLVADTGDRKIVRGIIGKHLGFSNEPGEPRDDEDFFFLGGDSITVSINEG